MIAQACRQARRAGVAQVPDQVAHDAQFLGRVDFPGGIAEQANIQAATRQALLQAEAAVDAELDQQVRADGAAAGRPGRSGHGGVRVDRKSQLYVRPGHNASRPGELGCCHLPLGGIAPDGVASNKREHNNAQRVPP